MQKKKIEISTTSMSLSIPEISIILLLPFIDTVYFIIPKLVTKKHIVIYTLCILS